MSNVPSTQPAPAENPLASEVADALGTVGQIIMYFASGNQIAAGRLAADLAISLVPADLLRAHLTAKGVALANEVADELERLKVGP